MRNELLDLVNKSIVFEYEVPNADKKILKTILSTDNDKCYSNSDSTSIAEIIYNSIIDYSFNQYELSEKDYEAMHMVALKTKLKYNESASEEQKLKYGFYGEVLLYCMLFAMFESKPIISRGYFYNPLENSETKGYDSYHLVQREDILELWFGEVKFHSSHTSGIKSALKNIEKAISDGYLEKNFLALTDRIGDFNVEGSQVELIIKEWLKNPSVNIIEFVKKYKVKLVYPIMILYDIETDSYDESISKVVDYIQSNYSSTTFPLSVGYSVFFILLPLKNVKEIKISVMKWIEEKKALMS